MQDYVYINPGPPIISGQIALPQCFHLTSCHKCGNKSIVCYVLYGTSHNSAPKTVCPKCFELSKEFEEKHPKESEILKSWKRDENWQSVGDG